MIHSIILTYRVLFPFRNKANIHLHFFQLFELFIFFLVNTFYNWNCFVNVRECINFLLISQCILLNETKFHQLWYLLKKIMCTSSQVRHHQKKAIRQLLQLFLERQFHDEFAVFQGLTFCLPSSKSWFVNTSKIGFSSRNDISKSNSHRIGTQSHMSMNLLTVRSVNCHNDHALMSPGSVLLFQ